MNLNGVVVFIVILWWLCYTVHVYPEGESYQYFMNFQELPL